MSCADIAEVILTPSGDVPDSVGTRSIPITRKEPLVTVGRSSRNKTKNLQPGSDNAYFDSPVMSRLHSWIKCDDEGKVLISDAGSMHGTFLDDIRLEPKRFVPLETGSQVRFGSSVTRGPDVFPPKAFDVKVIQNSRMAEIQHGYGITSDELILPDSPYYSSEEEDDDVVITDVKPINTVDLTSNSDNGNAWAGDKSQRTEADRWSDSAWSQRNRPKLWSSNSWSDEPPTEQTVTIIREPLRENVCIDLDPPSIIRDTNIVDLTAEAPISQQSKAPGARISITDLLAQERQEQSRRSSRTPVRNGSFSNERDTTGSDVEEESDTQSVEDFDLSDEESVDEDSISGPEATPESVPTSPFSPEPVKSSTSALPPLPPIQSPIPALVKEIVPPEIQKAWNSTWTAAPYLSPFVYAGGTPSASDSKPLDVTTSLTMSRDSITNLANRTKLAMEQVRKAEAMRDRAQEFLRSRIEMQSSRSQQASKEPEPTCAPQLSTNESTPKTDPTIPLWVRTFGQGAKVENTGEQSGENSVIQDALNPVVEIVECVSNPPETRSPSPILKMAGIFQVSDDEDEEEEEEEQDSDGDSWMNRLEDEAHSSSDSSVSDQDESEDISDDDEEVLCDLGCYSPAEDDYDDEDDVDEDDAMDYDQEDDCHDTESSPSDDDIVEEESVEKEIKVTIVQNPVKTAMSMENFFSPKDEEEVRSSQEDEIVKRWNAEIDDLFSGQADLEIEESNGIADVNMVVPDLLPPANKKRKRSESEDIDEYPHHAVASELEALEISTPRKIAPLPQRFLLSRTGQSTSATEAQSPREEAERKELLALASELKNELEAEAAEPEAKRPRVQSTGATWGSTIATAMAGALIGGVGVFAALVATAGDM
ncbi:hypothetical protein TWF281_007590 [Arthrobotrys megalospora]